jgi:hypothetical protein
VRRLAVTLALLAALVAGGCGGETADSLYGKGVNFCKGHGGMIDAIVDDNGAEDAVLCRDQTWKAY